MIADGHFVDLTRASLWRDGGGAVDDTESVARWRCSETEHYRLWTRVNVALMRGVVLPMLELRILESEFLFLSAILFWSGGN